MFDQCGDYMSLLQDMVEGACLISMVTICRCYKTWWKRHVELCGYYMSLLQDLVEEACLISVVTIYRCCKTWRRGHV